MISRFRKLQIGQDNFLSYALASSNPTMEIMREIRSLGESRDAIGLVLSIGTGHRPIPAFKTTRFAYLSAIRPLKLMLEMDGDHAHHVAIIYSENLFTYKRFDIGELPEEIKPDEWKTKKNNRDLTLERLEEATASYVQAPLVQREIRDTAKMLVENRCRRSKVTSRWKSFCQGEEIQT